MEEKIRVIDELEEKVGGRFQLTALLQKRIRELVAGAPPGSWTSARTTRSTSRSRRSARARSSWCSEEAE